MEYDIESLFGNDYLYFYRGQLSDERTDKEVAFIWDHLHLNPGQKLLDLCCGHGRLANPLASKGLAVTGLDASQYFLGLARESAQLHGVDVHYTLGDMRDLGWENHFDHVINWFTAFGYFREDEANREVLRQVVKVLKPGGKFGIELQYLPYLLRNFLETYTVERDGNTMIDEPRFNFSTSLTEVTRTIHRDGETRVCEFWVRCFMPAEIKSWLIDAGFSTVELLDEAGNPPGWNSRRTIAIATK